MCVCEREEKNWCVFFLLRSTWQAQAFGRSREREKKLPWILIANLRVCQSACVSSVHPAAHMVFYKSCRAHCLVRGEYLKGI